DTGMGLERLTSVIQGQISNYDTDLFQPIIQTIEKATGIEYIRNFKNIKADQAKAFDASNVAMRVLADHARATTFLVADGVTPSNEGRGYVLRRIMRRAIRYGRNLHEELSLLPKAVEKVIELMGEAYPEIVAQKNHILNVTRDEEKRFFQTLDQGLQILGSEFTSMEKSQNKVVSGKFVFKLYDTFGFPADLTRVIAREKGFEIDETSFDKQVEDAREVARASWKGKSLSTSDAELYKDIQALIKTHGSTKFTGYEGQTSAQGTLLLAFDGANNVAQLKSGQRGILISDKTSFYAESGGQVGDTGQITGTSGTAEVLDCTKSNDIYLHHVLVTDGTLNTGEKIQMSVYPVKRQQTANNHSGTHLLHAALRKVLGSQVTQAGSQVTPERLRFDFTYNKPMTVEEIAASENLVNNEISRSLKVETKIMTPKEAVAQGALALFGEKYGDQVRVLRMGDFSTELCGGTHVDNTSAIRFLKIVSEVGVSSGVRRIEAITGDIAAQFLFQHASENLAARNAFGMQEGWQQYLQGQKLKVADFILQLKEENKVLTRETKNLKSSSLDFDSLLKLALPFTVQNQSGHFLFVDLDGAEGQDREVLNQIVDRLRDKIKSGVIVMLGRAAASSASTTAQKSDTKDSLKSAELSHPLIVSLTPNLVGTLHAGKILGQLAAILGGKGGGRPDFAQGAAKDLSKILDAKKKLQEILSS
ncbi:MAG: alanine--tRNA ligase, partial [Bdellovibrionales bacterium]